MRLLRSLCRGRNRQPEVASAPAPVGVPEPVLHEPLVRLLSQRLVQDLTAASDVSYDEAWTRLFHLSVHSVALLDSPAGWISLAHQMGLSPRLTVH